jgi:DNA-binding NarL/FixJ family response regulator
LPEIRVALLGGSETLRAAKRVALSTRPNTKVVFDSDGFGLLPQDFLNVNFDVAIVEQRLGFQTAFEFIKIVQALSAMRQEQLGRILVAAQFHETQLRLLAIEAGAVDCVFISDGIETLVEKVSLCSEIDPDFAIRELIPDLGNLTISQEGFQNAAIALDTLDPKEAKVLKAFCQMKSISDIAVAVSVPKIKVTSTLNKIQKLLMLDTRSQLMLRMYRLGALAL